MYSGVVPQQPPTIEMPKSRDEPDLVLDELLGRQVVVHRAVDDRGQPGVGQHRHGDARVLRQVPHVLAHLLGAGRAVDADDVGAHRVERDERGADLGARQHAAGQLDGDLHLERHLDADLCHRVTAAVHRRLDAEQVELGLYQEHVDAAAQQAACLLGDLVAQLDIADVAQRREARARSDRAGDHARTVRCRVLLGGLSRDARRHLVELLGPVAQAVLVERGPHAAEAVRLDDVGAGLEVLRVHLADQLGAGLVQDLGAALELGGAVVLDLQVLLLQPGARSTVVDDHS